MTAGQLTGGSKNDIDRIREFLSIKRLIITRHTHDKTNLVELGTEKRDRTIAD